MTKALIDYRSQPNSAMPKGDNVSQASTYISHERHEDWMGDAEEMDMSLSEWVAAMVEAGRKRFEGDVAPDQTKDELRQEVRRLRRRVKQKNEEVTNLDSQLGLTEREAIIEYVELNEGVKYVEIVQHIQQSASGRVARMLDLMEGSELEIDEEGQVHIRD
jgi:hypothetical protein